MTNENETNWLKSVKDKFIAEGPGGGDFLYLLEIILSEGNANFIQILNQAANGHGCIAHEGLSYSLDQDWDDPSLFDEVTFFVGDNESSTLSINKYLSLIDVACQAYISLFPNEKEIVSENFNRISHRYSLAN